jgi:hypothetical protein
MPRTCSVCRSKKRKEVDRSIVEGIPYRNIVERCSVSLGALNRHRPHVAAAIVKAGERKGERREETLAEKFRALEIEAHRLKKVAEETGDIRAAFVGLDRLIDLAKLYGEAKQPTPAETREKAARYAAAVGVPVDELLRVAEELAAEIALPAGPPDLAKELKEALELVRARKSRTTFTPEQLAAMSDEELDDWLEAAGIPRSAFETKIRVEHVTQAPPAEKKNDDHDEPKPVPVPPAAAPVAPKPWRMTL